MFGKISVIADTKYHCEQFDDWLAGGKIEYQGKIYYWSAQDSNYGFGWEIEPTDEENWNDISGEEMGNMITLIRQCLYEHKTEYVF